MDKDNIQVIDRRKHPFTMLDNRLIALDGYYLKEFAKGSKLPLIVYLLIISHQNNKSFIPSLNKISKSLNVNRGKLTLALKKLTEMGLISYTTKIGFKNIIYINDLREKSEEGRQPISQDKENEIIKGFLDKFKSATPKTKTFIESYLTGKVDEIPDGILATLRPELESVRSKLSLVNSFKNSPQKTENIQVSK